MYRPTTRDELLGLLDDLGPDAKLLAGGTAFTILRKSGLLRPDPRHPIHRGRFGILRRSTQQRGGNEGSREDQGQNYG